MPPEVPADVAPPRPQLARHRLWSQLSVHSKRSARSFHTSSFEADDERSSLSDDGGMASSESQDGATPRVVLSYAGQDVRPTSRKELWGWYTYAFAAETYVICGFASFIPILLESLARENGVLRSDPTKPCRSSDSRSDDDNTCVVYVGGVQINTASFAMYVFSVSVLLQALLVVSISCAADHGNYRKKLLLGFGWVGSFSVMAFLFVSKEIYMLGALLTIISNVSFGASFVLLNSFLPLLVRYHPGVLEIQGSVTPDLGQSHLESRPLEDSSGDVSSSMVDSVSALLENGTGDSAQSTKRHASHEDIVSREMDLSTQISAKGIGIGYGGALFVQCLSIGILIAMHNTTWSQRVVLFMIGAWWTIFTVPAAMWLRPRPGPPLVDGERKSLLSGFSYLLYAWKSLFKTIGLARRLKDITLFLAGWFLVSDAVATTSGTAILFAKTSLHMQPWALGLINVISTLMGVVGALGWSWVSRKFSLKPHQTILVCIALFELIPLYGLMGYLPFVRSWGVLGLQQPWEMYPLAAVYGLVLGGLGGYCRSLYGELIPPGSEAAFYALYAITDKGSSVFGPTIVGAIINKTGSIRPAFWFLAALVGLPAPFIWFINVERGKRDGLKVAELIESFAGAHEEESRDERETRGMLDDYDEPGHESDADGR
ncbi:hypothetical protein S7711_08288 [Stachybotrys chartarum IBT 7711]|uniref:Autophagy-related protein n=1 Tax=Stachybotrys chartarum (strain CBS 109288 / IBT 7711) TaxID=1280523 RepID=A0A084AIQ1_STACB|nr:hypothetical protein S7711_08288 [Stachybotrys chartarum IBT 7711]KFA48502.1 hypothetical protein S40293_00297 [Stachybotrys chartarum IBT 40293]KFA74799.1 hypothetical protein S40288_03520 [Stachybotrys chartarum IBT 40288]